MQAAMFGARLAYVVRELPGTVKREVCRFDKEKNAVVKELVDQPAGFMVYFPRGHAIRLKTREDLRHYNLDGEPAIINMDGIHDRNSPAGRLMFAQTEKARKGAMMDLENMVIALATAKSGPRIMPEQNVELPTGNEDVARKARVA